MSRKIKDSNINPKHYRAGGIELIDVMVAKMTPEEMKGFCKGLALKYIFRADLKNGIEDYEKARWYLDYLVEFLKKEEKKAKRKARSEESKDEDSEHISD